MLIELKICLPPESLGQMSARDFAALAEDIDLPQARESARVIVEFVQRETNPVEFMTSESGRGRRALIIVSPKLVDTIGDGCSVSNAAQRLLERSWERRVVVGLVGVTDRPDAHVTGLDAVVSPDALRGRLRAIVQRVASRLWFKVAPPIVDHDTVRDARQWEVGVVRDAQTLRKCLALRHKVYSALGYLDPEVAAAQLRIDLDGYDTRAKQFVVIDRSSQRVAATARLISPGILPWLNGPLNTPNYVAWCNALAREEPGRVYRRLLARPFVTPLPILDSFAHFNNLSDQQRYQPLVYPQYSCELSRVVVDPDYRGFGLLRLLMERAIEEARINRKRYLLLECAPFHEQMYAKFGFKLIEDNGRCHYTRAQRLDSWAVAMHLDLKEEHRISAAPGVFRVPVERPDSLPLDIAISDPELDDDFIESRLRAPFIAPRGSRYIAGRVSKGTYCPLLARLRRGFVRPDMGLCNALRELHSRLPNANVRLLSGSDELLISDPGCRRDSDCDALLGEVSTWLEKLSVTV